jgi:hypothetical protein
METPDRLRGRMTGINMMFFQGGPQLGELEAGLVAHWAGAPFSVISGGIGCLVATAVIAANTPQLRHYRAGHEREREAAVRQAAPPATARTAAGDVPSPDPPRVPAWRDTTNTGRKVEGRGGAQPRNSLEL